MIGTILAAALASPQLHTYSGVALAPRGDRVAVVESVEADPAKTSVRPHGVIVVRSAADGAVLARLDPCPKCEYASAVWSPDGSALAFFARNSAGTNALEIARGASVATIAKITGEANTLRWSPDGTTLAMLATIGARKHIGATQAGIPLVGEIETRDDEQRIAVIPARGGAAPKLVSPADTFVYEYDWTPDGRGFVATAAKGNGDDNWWIAKLDAIGVDGTVRTIAAPSMQMNVPRVSPDGKTVAFIGGIMSDFGSIGGDLYTVPLAGGTPVDVTPDYAGTFTGYVWNKTGLSASALIGDRAALVSVDPATHATNVLWSAPQSVYAADGRFSFSADRGTVATVAQDFEHAPHVVVGSPAALHAITHDNDAIAPVVASRSVSWTNDGFHVQGWLVGPRVVAPGKTYPMIVLVHGGPSAAVTPTFVAQGTVADLVRHGYYVFQANPRGSYGQGEAFTRANVKDFGGGDLRDILAGVDAVEKIAPVDDKRLGVYGHSYGGFMTMWTVTHSQRFHAAVAGAGVADWISYYGENGINTWMTPFFGATAYDDPKPYDAASPILSIKKAHTPTFVYVGERDVECPAPQSLEFFNGLRAMHVPSDLVIYAGEGHGIRDPKHVRDLSLRIVGWFDRYLRG
ncbi:MAG TPA: S9 family peptidase [Candidatus Limnocylindria bacterium]|nr:S9 family peptidase [Candidatus Limnocylindria bacterium]